MKIPKYRLHRGGGRNLAAVTINGKRIYLGKFGSEESKKEYNRLVSQWLDANREALPPAPPGHLTVAELLVAYWHHAERHYRKCGEPVKGQLATIKVAFGPLRRRYGETRAADFGKQELKQVRRDMIDARCSKCKGAGKCTNKNGTKNPTSDNCPDKKGTETPCRRCNATGKRPWTREFINKAVGVVRQAFRWACEEDMIPDAVWHALTVIKPLEKGRDGVRPDPEPIGPVSQDAVEKTLAFLNQIVADMVRVQRYALMRPCEVRGMRACDIDRSGRLPDGECLLGVWVYLVSEKFNKLAHKQIERVVILGPKAQAVLAP
jgi:hypothetical protein